MLLSIWTLNFPVEGKLMLDHSECHFYKASISFHSDIHDSNVCLFSMRNGIRRLSAALALGLSHLVLQSSLQITSFTELNTGRPRWVFPPFPGEIPPTRLVPYSNACWLWKVPCERERISKVKMHTKTNLM